ncbi:MAG: aminotransferase class V-fold PLP-dependent enzyme [Labilithrix sp.]|nr:aminotransferase class V-fold PLP-dependent enzyme [Labilithrix sp.]
MKPAESSPKVARRSFFGLASALVGSACAAPAAPKLASVTSGGAGWAALRDDFLLARDRVQLGNLLIASNPRPVREAIERHRKRLDEDPVGVVEHDLHTGELTHATLDAAARYMGASRDEIALTDSTTSGIAVVYGGLVLQRGDEIITTKHDHFVTHESVRLAAERTGATIKTVALYDEGREATRDAMAAAIDKAISPATRAIAMTWVHSSTGVKTPVKAIADVVAKANASRGPKEKILLCVDGVHGFGVENASMADLGCDVFMAGCHKWIFGPRGTGVVWARKEAWARMRPTACPFDWDYIVAREMGEGEVPPPSGRTMTPGGFRAFEHRWALRDAFDYHLRIGKAAIEQRMHELASRCKAGLAKMRHVTLHTPIDPALSSGIVTFEVAGIKPDDVVAKLLAAKVVGTTTPYRPSYARFTPGIVNTPEEIDRALEVVARLA